MKPVPGKEKEGGKQGEGGQELAERGGGGGQKKSRKKFKFWGSLKVLGGTKRGGKKEGGQEREKGEATGK